MSPYRDVAQVPALPDFDRWPLREALRHRAVLVHDASGPAVLCADRDADPLLLQAAENPGSPAPCAQ